MSVHMIVGSIGTRPSLGVSTYDCGEHRNEAISGVSIYDCVLTLVVELCISPHQLLGHRAEVSQSRTRHRIRCLLTHTLHAMIYR